MGQELKISCDCLSNGLCVHMWGKRKPCWIKWVFLLSRPCSLCWVYTLAHVLTLQLVSWMRCWQGQEGEGREVPKEQLKEVVLHWKGQYRDFFDSFHSQLSFGTISFPCKCLSLKLTEILLETSGFGVLWLDWNHCKSRVGLNYLWMLHKWGVLHFVKNNFNKYSLILRKRKLMTMILVSSWPQFRHKDRILVCSHVP